MRIGENVCTKGRKSGVKLGGKRGTEKKFLFFQMHTELIFDVI